MTITCEYCGREQSSEPARCISCGAPLPVPPPVQTRVTMVEEPLPVDTPATPAEPLVTADQLKEGLAAAGAVVGSLGIGTIVLRVAAQGFAIAVASFIVGLNAGGAVAGQTRYLPHLLTALLGGALLGVVVLLMLALCLSLSRLAGQRRFCCLGFGGLVRCGVPRCPGLRPPSDRPWQSR